MRESQLKNKPALGLGLATAVFSLLYLPEILQFVVSILSGVETDFNFWLIFPQTSITLSTEHHWSVYLIIESIPIIYLVIVSEICGYFLRKSYPGFVRYYLIIVLLVYIGHMILSMFLNAISIILRMDIVDGYKNLVVYYNVSEIYSMVYIFITIIFLSFYINFITKRVLQYINY